MTFINIVPHQLQQYNRSPHPHLLGRLLLPEIQIILYPVNICVTQIFEWRTKILCLLQFSLRLHRIPWVFMFREIPEYSRFARFVTTLLYSGNLLCCASFQKSTYGGKNINSNSEVTKSTFFQANLWDIHNLDYLQIYLSVISWSNTDLIKAYVFLCGLLGVQFRFNIWTVWRHSSAHSVFLSFAVSWNFLLKYIQTAKVNSKICDSLLLLHVTYYNICYYTVLTIQ